MNVPFDDNLSVLRWDSFFMEMAYLVASKSKDRSTKVGAVAVGEGHTMLSMGYNGFVRYCDDEDAARHERPEKYFWTAHAELNVICNAARTGTKLLDAVLYTTSHPCTDCARAIVQSGFKEVILPSKENDPFWVNGRWGEWEENFKKAREILNAAEVKVIDHVVR
jgi:dCMP deaminase